MRVRHMSYRTEQCYLHWLRRFVAFHGRRNPAHLDEAAVCAFLSHLAVQEKVAASTQNQAFHALLFFYREVLGQKELHWRNVQRAPRSKRLTVVLTREEIRSVLLHMEGQTHLMAALLYGCGLRLQDGRKEIRNNDALRKRIRWYHHRGRS